MKLYSTNEDYKLYQGSMLDMLEVIKPNTINSIVCDPPYELNFMNKGWDNSGIAFQPDTWKKCYEVLKPGGYLLAFGGSRTFHRIACAIEDAGFEIRDTIMWIYGMGFPKSMDISKSLDKRNGRTNDEFIELGNYLKEKITDSDSVCAEKMGFSPALVRFWKLGERIPNKETWLKLKSIYDLDNDFDWLIEREEAEREIIGNKKTKDFSKHDGSMMSFTTTVDYKTNTTNIDITIPSTDLAKQWQGWGTSLKPSFEPIIVARKPFKGSLVDNVIKNGVGGINIDECRVKTIDVWHRKKAETNTAIGYQRKNKSMYAQKSEGEMNENGRFPANTILTYDETDFDEVCGGFPNTKGGKRHNTAIRKSDKNSGYGFDINTRNEFNDSGSASRYFYCAKASKKDRDEGLNIEIEEYVLKDNVPEDIKDKILNSLTS